MIAGMTAQRPLGSEVITGRTARKRNAGYIKTWNAALSELLFSRMKTDFSSKAVWVAHLIDFTANQRWITQLYKFGRAWWFL
jgi:hypothetical protein